MNNSIFSSAIKNINLTSILNSVNKGLSLIQKAMPIYEEAKPLLKNAKQYISKFNQDKKIQSENFNVLKKEDKTNNQPTFFQ